MYGDSIGTFSHSHNLNVEWSIATILSYSLSHTHINIQTQKHRPTHNLHQSTNTPLVHKRNGIKHIICNKRNEHFFALCTQILFTLSALELCFSFCCFVSSRWVMTQLRAMCLMKSPLIWVFSVIFHFTGKTDQFSSFSRLFFSFYVLWNIL